MAILTFSKGEETNLPENRNEDNIYITSDTGKGFLGDKQLWVTPTELVNKFYDKDYIDDNFYDKETVDDKISKGNVIVWNDF